MQLADEEREQIRRVLSRVQGPRDVPRRGAEGGSEEEAEGDLRGHAGQGPLRGLAPQKWKRAAAPMGWRQHGENLGRSTEKTVDKTIGTPPPLALQSAGDGAHVAKYSTSRLQRSRELISPSFSAFEKQGK